MLLFTNDQPFGYYNLDDNSEATPIFKGMKVMITQNRDKRNNVVNGQMAEVATCHGNTIFLKMPENKIALIHPVTSNTENGNVTCYPIRIAYAITMCKSQGQTLSKTILWFDRDNIPPGTGYVALSRVRKMSDISFLTPLKPCYFTPVS